MVKYTRATSEPIRHGILDQYRLRPDYPPTYRELAAALSAPGKPVHVNTIRHHVNALVTEGKLVYSGAPGQSRNIRLASRPPDPRLEQLSRRESTIYGIIVRLQPGGDATAFVSKAAVEATFMVGKVKSFAAGLANLVTAGMVEERGDGVRPSEVVV